MGGIDSAVNAVSEEKYNPVDKIRKFPLRKKPSPEELIKGVSEGDRKTLSQAITLIESNAPRDFDKAQRVLQALLPRTGKALRIGISGVTFVSFQAYFPWRGDATRAYACALPKVFWKDAVILPFSLI